MENVKENKVLQKIKNILKKWWFWLIIIILIALVITLIHIINKPSFNVVDFKISKEVKEYQYSDDTVYYTGEGKITTKDTKGIYLVVLKETLLQRWKF